MPLDVIMPALGMAQDSGLLVSWKKQPGDKVVEGDVLFEVETDKSTVEVEAQAAGYLTHITAKAGEDVPVGRVIARISDTQDASAEPAEGPPDVASSIDAEELGLPGAPKAEAAPLAQVTTAAPAPKPAKASAPAAAPSGRILASPKARRLALERGLDFERLVKSGVPQPYHVRDLTSLSKLLLKDNHASPAELGRRLEADLSTEGFTAFAEWAALEADRDDATGMLASLAAASLRRATGSKGAMAVTVERFGTEALYLDAHGQALGAQPAGEDASPSLRLRDLRGARITELALGPEDVPVLTLMTRGTGLRLVLECGPDQLSARNAIVFLSEFAGRIEDPLRHLL